MFFQRQINVRENRRIIKNRQSREKSNIGHKTLKINKTKTKIKKKNNMEPQKKTSGEFRCCYIFISLFLKLTVHITYTEMLQRNELMDKYKSTNGISREDKTIIFIYLINLHSFCRIGVDLLVINCF